MSALIGTEIDGTWSADFMFQLSQDEKTEVVTNCDHLAKLKYSRALPYAFTEHGALMLGNVAEIQPCGRGESGGGTQPASTGRPIGFTTNIKGDRK